MTFLDLVRVLGKLSRDRCHPECSESVHRREVASTLGLLLENPDLLNGLRIIAARLDYQNEYRTRDSTGTRG
jgi:hypothetical protein